MARDYRGFVVYTERAMKIEFYFDDLVEAILGHASFTMSNGAGAFTTQAGTEEATIVATAAAKELMKKRKQFVSEYEISY